MRTYVINSECGVETIRAEDVEAAKDQYARMHHYDFDAYSYYPGSWYFVTEDGLRIEDHTECMP